MALTEYQQREGTRTHFSPELMKAAPDVSQGGVARILHLQPLGACRLSTIRSWELYSLAGLLGLPDAVCFGRALSHGHPQGLAMGPTSSRQRYHRSRRHSRRETTQMGRSAPNITPHCAQPNPPSHHRKNRMPNGYRRSGCPVPQGSLHLQRAVRDFSTTHPILTSTGYHRCHTHQR